MAALINLSVIEHVGLPRADTCGGATTPMLRLASVRRINDSSVPRRGLCRRREPISNCSAGVFDFSRQRAAGAKVELVMDHCDNLGKLQLSESIS
jgi:hypothetical protein